MPGQVGGISTAEWTGVRLRDVLHAAGLSLEESNPEAKHVVLQGHDKDLTGAPYATSIPMVYK